MPTQKNIGGYLTEFVVDDIASPGEGIVVNEEIISFKVPQIPIQYISNKMMNSTFVPTVNLPTLTDSTYMGVMRLSVVKTANDVNDQTITFETVSINQYPPLVTLMWVATAAAQSTIFATNSGSLVYPNVANSALSCYNIRSNWTPNLGVRTMYYDASASQLYIGGDFTGLNMHTEVTATTSIGGILYNGITHPNAFNSYYSLISLSGGTAFVGASAVFGPTGAPLSASSVGYAGGTYGIQFDKPVNCILPVTVGDKSYICYGGNFTSFWYGTSAGVWTTAVRKAISAIACTGLLIVDKSNPAKYARFNIPNKVNCLEFDGSNLYIGGPKGGVPQMYANLRKPSGAEVVRSTCGTGITGYVFPGLARIDLDYNSDASDLWDRFNFGNTNSNTFKFNNNVFTKLGPNANPKVAVVVNALYYRDMGLSRGLIYAGGTHSALLAQDGNYGANTNHTGVTVHLTHSELEYNLKGGPGEFYYNSTAEIIQKSWSRLVVTGEVLHISADSVKAGVKSGSYYTNTIYVAGACTMFQRPTVAIKGLTAKSYPRNNIAAFAVPAKDLTENELASYTANQYAPDGCIFPLWNPVFDGIVRCVAVEDVYTYVLGNFKKVNGVPRSGLAALGEPVYDTNDSLNVNWANDLVAPSMIGPGMGQLIVIPNTDPLSGLLVAGTFTGVFGDLKYKNVARVTKIDQSIMPFVPKSTRWEMSVAVLGENAELDIDSTKTVLVTSEAHSSNKLGMAQFPMGKDLIDCFEGADPGDPVRILLKRRNLIDGQYNLSATQEYSGEAFVIGATISYNSKEDYDSYISHQE